MTENSTANKLTIIATVLNEAHSIGQFIDSLLAQSLPADEIIIVDGESSDGTLEILNNYAAQGQIRVLSKACNIAEGRNHAISHATNELIAVTDSGCKVDQNWLYEIAQCFLAEPVPDVVAGNFKFEFHNIFEEAIVLATFNPERETTEAAIYYPSSRSIAFKKSAWQAAKGYPEWLYAAEDTLFNIRLRQLGFKFVFAQEAIVYWRPRESYRALTKQRFNFARGNARVGIGTQGYQINLYYHGIILLSFMLMPWSIWFIIPAGYFSWQHIKKHLWAQAKKAERYSTTKNIKYHVLLLMEHSRFIGILGFLAGRWDRFNDKKFITSQYDWMGIKSLDELRNVHEITSTTS